jgi:NAD(P)-dependent dehydrogenase (short-subunit alcohol dehydrogenase family)
LALAQAGADIALLDICENLSYPTYPMATRTELEETAADVRELGRRALPLICDVRNAEQVAAAVEKTVAELGAPDILVCNAGVAGLGASWEISEEAWDAMIDINLKGSWLCAKYVVPHMIARRSGKIIFISSSAGLKPLSWMAHYNAAKMGVVALMKTMAIELGQYNINVNSIHPTGVDTAIISGEAAEAGISRAQLAAQIGERNLLPVELMPPQAISDAVVWLASDASRFVTGHTLAVDAGYTVG